LNLGWVALVWLATLFGMGFAAKLLPYPHQVRFGIIVVLWLIGTTIGLAGGSLVKIAGDVPPMTQLAMRLVMTGGGMLVWLWALWGGFALSARRAGLGRKPALWSTRIGRALLLTAGTLWLAALVAGEAVRRI